MGSRPWLDTVSEVDQALFGYGNGHQLLASSIRLPSESARQLRALTDMAFDGHAQCYLTALPLPELRRYALIRSWPAAEGSRRGSVWSHGLLIDFVVLASLDDLGALTTLFRRPQRNQPEELANYEHELSLPTEGSDVAPVSARGELDRLLWGVYGHDDDAVIRTDDAPSAEALLFDIWKQQWPRLRRDFAFRTRYRVSAQSGPFDVQVVERLEKDQQQPQPPEPTPSWIVQLKADMNEPAHRLSAFLRRFGSESPDGRRDMSTLVDIAELIWTDVYRPTVVKLIGSSFQQARQMPTLKRDLLGGPTKDDAGVWNAPEAERLRLLLYASPTGAFDLQDLRVESRIDTLWRCERDEARALLECIDFSDSENPGVRAALLSTAIREAQPADLVAVSEANPEVAVVVVKERSDLLADPTLWQGSPALVDFLLDLLVDAEPQTRQEILLRLLDADAFDGAARLVEREPDLWWCAFRWAAESGQQVDELAGILERLLDSAGAGAIGAMPGFERTPRLLETLAVCAPPSLGLWRQVDSAQWQSVAKSWKTVPNRPAQLRMLVVLLAAAKSAQDAGVRCALWRQAFPPLHTALVKTELSGPDLQTLIGLLAKPSDIQEWDHAGRLRAALAMEIRRGSWPQGDVEDIVRAAKPYEEALLKALAAGKKKKKSWLRELAEQILP